MKAFPIPHTVVDANDPAFKLGQAGMDLRDYFAAKAMQELIFIFSNEALIETGDERREAVAIAAYKQADAMMRARGND